MVCPKHALVCPRGWGIDVIPAGEDGDFPCCPSQKCTPPIADPTDTKLKVPCPVVKVRLQCYHNSVFT